MGIKKKNRVSPDFNMSSLTDIIFLLLIFFMLTSSMVIPNALNLQLPGKKQRSTPSSNDTPTTVDIRPDGVLFFNNQRMSLESIEKKLAQLKRSRGEDAVITISASAKASNVDLVGVMDIAYRYEIKSVLLDPQ